MSVTDQDGIKLQRPGRFLIRMILFLVAVGLIGVALGEPLERAFQANVALNGLIAGVLVIGIIYSFRQVLMLWPEITWVNKFRVSDPGLMPSRPPSLLAPMATMLSDRQGRLTLSPTSMRSLLDSISSRLDESGDLSRYMIGLLIFLGLLGTFWGLLDTVSSVGDTIRTLNVDGNAEDSANVFQDLKAGLEAPLAGMGTAFSSSLFGLGGSLILGFLDLQSSQAQNRFYNNLEEWLSSITQLTSGAGFSESEAGVPAYVTALLEQTADNLHSLQTTFERSQDERNSANQHLATLAEQLAMLTDMMKAEQQILIKVAEGQMELKPILERLGTQNGFGDGINEVTSGHIRNIDVTVKHLVDELSEGRSELLRDLKAEIKLLTKTVANLNDVRK